MNFYWPMKRKKNFCKRNIPGQLQFYQMIKKNCNGLKACPGIDLFSFLTSAAVRFQSQHPLARA
jgi:hypothetical protein